MRHPTGLRDSWLGAFATVVVGATVYLLLLGCGPGAKKVQGATVLKVHGGGYGKGLFIVSPRLSQEREQKCRVKVGASEDDLLSCESEYLVACDVSWPANQPFCRLVREQTVDRYSLYPRMTDEPPMSEPPPVPSMPPGTPPPPAQPVTPPPGGNP